MWGAIDTSANRPARVRHSALTSCAKRQPPAASIAGSNLYAIETLRHGITREVEFGQVQRTVSDKLAKGEGTLGKLLNDDSLYTGAQSTLKKAERALDGMGDSGPITAVGVVANALF